MPDATNLQSPQWQVELTFGSQSLQAAVYWFGIQSIPPEHITMFARFSSSSARGFCGVLSESVNTWTYIIPMDVLRCTGENFRNNTNCGWLSLLTIVIDSITDEE
jgi:hypothetical protein